MAIITEDLVQSSVVSSTGVSNWDRTTASDDSKASFATVSNGNGNVIFELTNLSQTPTSIISAQIIHESTADAAATAVIQSEMLNSSNTQINTEFTSFSLTSDSVKSLTTYTSNALTGTAFTENDINTLRVKFTYITESGAVGDALVDHVYVRVKYNIPDPSGGRIFISNGAIRLTNGTIQIKA